MGISVFQNGASVEALGCIVIERRTIFAAFVFARFVFAPPVALVTVLVAHVIEVVCVLVGADAHRRGFCLH